MSLSAPKSLAGGAVASRPGQLAWAFYEFATGPYFIMINIFVFAAYFAKNVVGDPVEGQALWGYLQGGAGLAIALASPILGALSDAAGPRKPGIALFTLLGTAAMTGLWLAEPGAIALAAGCVVAASVMMEFAGVYHQALLPGIVSQRRVGGLSGLGYALSFLGAMLTFAIWLALPQSALLPGVAFAHERSVGLLVAAWCLAFALPLFFLTPDMASRGLATTLIVQNSFRTLRKTLSKLPYFANIARYLIARMVYYDGLNAVFIFIGIYASGVFGWSTGQVGIYGLIIIIVAAVSAIFGGLADDRFGSRATILVSLAAFTLLLTLAISMSRDTLFFGVPISPDANAAGLPVIGPAIEAIGFPNLTEHVFILFGVLSGFFVGPAQASSRTMLARIAPPSMIGEFFGLYTLTGKATSFLAPTLIGVMTAATGNQRAGFAVILVFTTIGFALLLTVREEQTDAPPEG